jgi:proline racemase
MTIGSPASTEPSSTRSSVRCTSATSRALGQVPDGLLTEVEGTAFRTGEHRFFLDPRDPLGTGFVLR